MKNFLGILTLVLVFACSKSDFVSVSPAKIANFYLSDCSQYRSMPDSIAFQQLNIDLQLVRIKTNSDSGGWQDLLTNAGIYNLVDYQDGLDTLISTGVILADTIKELRLILGEDNSIMVDSVLHDISIPSGSQSGLKIKFQPGYALSGIDSLMIDFNSQASVHQVGNGAYKLQPVIHVE